MAVTAFSFFLPDLIDKPLWVLEVISDSRYIGHTLLLAFLVAFAFAIKKRVYGLFAICGMISHLLLDTGGFIPWFYPFKGYDFPNVGYHGIVTWYNVAGTLAEMAFVVIVVAFVVFLVLSFSSWAGKRCKPRARRVSQSTPSSERETVGSSAQNGHGLPCENHPAPSWLGPIPGCIRYALFTRRKAYVLADPWHSGPQPEHTLCRTLAGKGLRGSPVQYPRNFCFGLRTATALITSLLLSVIAGPFFGQPSVLHDKDGKREHRNEHHPCDFSV